MRQQKIWKKLIGFLNRKKTTDIETVEEVVEVDSAAEEGTEIVEEVIEVDENGNEISREKK